MPLDSIIKDPQLRAQVEALSVEARQKLAVEFLDRQATHPGRLEDFLRSKDLGALAEKAKASLSDADLAKHLADARAQYETVNCRTRSYVTLADFAGAYLSERGFEIDAKRIEEALKR